MVTQAACRRPWAGMGSSTLTALAVLAVAVLAVVGGGPLARVSGGPLAGRDRIAGSHASGSGTVDVRVEGNHLVNAEGAQVRLLGVDRSGTEYACAQGWAIFDGPSSAASVAAIAAWHADAVRVPLNEDCWLGINGVRTAYGGSAYRQAIEAYVRVLHAAGMVAVLDLHWNAPGTELATGQQVMADATHSPAFWSSVASAFASTHGVVFDLYNEPHTISWTCWLHGCTTPGGWRAAGMQTLLDAVRAAGATQPVMLGGLNWAGTLSGWLSHEPVDPDHQLVASVHLYNFSACARASCWDATIAPVAARVPVVTGELGETDCGQSFVDSYMQWADAHGISYLGWAWDAGGGWTCTGGPSLIDGYTGAPSGMGTGFRAHFASVAAAHPGTLAVSGSTSPPGSGTGPPVAGYWLADTAGDVFAFGGAASHGSMTGQHLNQPVVGMAATKTGGGYWLVASDGGIFTFGNAAFLGSMGGSHLNQPIVGMAAAPTGGGYWLVARDGGIFAFGTAGFFGSAVGTPAGTDAAQLVATSAGGYLVASAAGDVAAFGSATFSGNVTTQDPGFSGHVVAGALA